MTVRVCESDEIHGLDGRVRPGTATSGVAGTVFLFSLMWYNKMLICFVLR